MFSPITNETLENIFEHNVFKLLLEVINRQTNPSDHRKTSETITF